MGKKKDDKAKALEAAEETTGSEDKDDKREDGDVARKGERDLFPQNMVMRVEQPLGKNYSGGPNLAQFERGFRGVARLNHWNDKTTAQMLQRNLSGHAKAYIESLGDEDQSMSVGHLRRTSGEVYHAVVANVGDDKAGWNETTRRRIGERLRGPVHTGDGGGWTARQSRDGNEILCGAYIDKAGTHSVRVVR